MKIAFESAAGFISSGGSDIRVGNIPVEVGLLQQIRSVRNGSQPVTIIATPPVPGWYSLPRLIQFLNRPAFADASFRIVVPDARKAQEFMDGLWVLPPDSSPVVVARMEHERTGIKLWFVHGSIAGARTEALVNASNPALRLGAGVSGALKERFPGLQSEMVLARSRFLTVNNREFGDGDSVTTGMPGTGNPRFIIHTATVAGTADVIEAGIRSMLAEVNRYGIRSVTIPALGTGTGGFPVPDFIRIFQSVLVGSDTLSPDLRLELIHLKRPELNRMTDEFIRSGWKTATDT